MPGAKGEECLQFAAFTSSRRGAQDATARVTTWGEV
jgi:hypothetical protein